LFGNGNVIGIDKAATFLVPVIIARVGYYKESEKAIGRKKQSICLNMAEVAGYDATLLRCEIDFDKQSPKKGKKADTTVAVFSFVFNVPSSRKEVIAAAFETSHEVFSYLSRQQRRKILQLDIFEGGSVEEVEEGSTEQTVDGEATLRQTPSSPSPPPEEIDDLFENKDQGGTVEDTEVGTVPEPVLESPSPTLSPSPTPSSPSPTPSSPSPTLSPSPSPPPGEDDLFENKEQGGTVEEVEEDTVPEPVLESPSPTLSPSPTPSSPSPTPSSPSPTPSSPSPTPSSPSPTPSSPSPENDVDFENEGGTVEDVEEETVPEPVLAPAPPPPGGATLARRVFY
jgi:hypothetical protein